MRYLIAKKKEQTDREMYEIYSADCMALILRKLGTGVKLYSEIKYPEPVDNRDPEEIAMERAANMGLTIVS